MSPVMSPPTTPPAGAQEYLVINGVNFANAAWRVTSLFELLRGPDHEGADRKIPTGPVITYPRRPTVSRRSVPLVVTGRYNHLGNAYADPRAGLIANLDYLQFHVFDPVQTGDGLRPASLYLAGGFIKNARVRVLPVDITSMSPIEVRGIMDLDIALPGRFV